VTEEHALTALLDLLGAVDLKKAEAKVPGIPAKPKQADEVKRALELRVNERYGSDGNLPRDEAVLRALVDLWVARAGVVFATEVLLAVCAKPQEPRNSAPSGAAYELRRDGQPWARLREHLAAASEADQAAAKALAAKARSAKSELRQAVAYAFADPSWVAADLDGMFEAGYGQLALLTALPDAATARQALLRLLGKADIDEYIAEYQLVEEAPPHMPNLIATLDSADAALVKEAAKLAWNKVVAKPWLELVGSLGKAKGGAKPAKAPAKKAAAKPAKKAAAKPAKKTAAKPAKKR
jgi:hypothetical protein